MLSPALGNTDQQAVVIGVGIGEYEGVLRVLRQACRRFVDGAVTPEQRLSWCIGYRVEPVDGQLPATGGQSATSAVGQAINDR